MAHEPIPETIEEARRLSIERLKANGHAPVVQRSNGHAPAAPAAEQVNWAQLIAQQATATELHFERQTAALKEEIKQLTELVAKKSGGISEGEVTVIAKATAQLVRDRIAGRVAPLEKRVDELENIVRTLVQGVADRKRIIATTPYGDADSGSSGRFVHAVGGRVSL